MTCMSARISEVESPQYEDGDFTVLVKATIVEAEPEFKLMFGRKKRICPGLPAAL